MVRSNRMARLQHAVRLGGCIASVWSMLSTPAWSQAIAPQPTAEPTPSELWGEDDPPLELPSVLPKGGPKQPAFGINRLLSDTLPDAQPVVVPGTPGDAPVDEPAAPPAASSATPPQEAKPTVTQERLAELVQGVQSATGLDEAVKTDLLKRYQTAQEWLQTAEAAEQKTTQFEQEIAQVGELTERARGELAANTPDTPAPAASGQTLPELEGQLAQAQSQLEQAKTLLDQREGELKRRGERKGELGKLLEETRGRLEETEKSLAAAGNANDSPELATARRMELETRRRAMRAQLALYQTEAKRLDTLVDLFPLQRDLAARQVLLSEKQVSQLQQLVDQVRKQESERQAQEARRQAELADPGLTELANSNTLLADERKSIAERITKISQEVTQNEKQLATLNNSFERARDKVSKAGHSTTVGLMLRRQREELPNMRRCDERLAFVEREMPEVNLKRLELEDERAALSDLDSMAQRIALRLAEQSGAMTDENRQQRIRELLGAKRDLMDRLLNEMDTYLVELSELEVSNRNLIAQTKEFREFTDEHILWIRSSEPYGVSVLGQVADGLKALFKPAQWGKLIKASGLDTLRQPLMAAAVAGAFLLLVVFHTQMHRRIRELCGTRLNSVGWRFAPSIRALLWTAVATATLPLPIWYLGWRMTDAEQTSELGLALGPSLQYAAMLSWLSGFLISLCRRHGVAETFFTWSPDALVLGRRSLRWLTVVGLPLACIVRICQVYDHGVWSDSLGRTAFVLVMLMLALFVHWTMGKRRNIFREALAKDSAGWLHRVRAAAHTVGILLPLSLAGLAMVGYYYSSLHLAVRLQATLGLALAVLLVHAVISRWFVVTRRRLAMQQVRDRQQAADVSETPAGVASVTTPPLDGPDWSEVHDRLRILLRQAVTVAILAGIWVIWNDVLPALKILDRVELWTQTVEVTETIEDSRGELVRKAFSRDVPTTLRHGLIAAVCLLGTFILGRNLPALLQITVLNQLPLDRGGRHAISVLVYYAVALTGVLVACRTLHIYWSSVQWLAAGITVGLGFGLQEIFANFVSGIILLFERPIRVGDVITLDDVSGTVTSIRMRATTVTNWDLKELIVPNKALITGRLLNWTLSDTLNRIVINLGLAYATEPARAEKLLMEVVRSHPNVLADPEPTVSFEGFGESSLNFVIRGFLANLDVRQQTVHDLHVELHRRLKEANIEVAFPQREVTLHLPGPLPPLEPSLRDASRRRDAA
jgi:potassium efflux system protein